MAEYLIGINPGAPFEVFTTPVANFTEHARVVELSDGQLEALKDAVSRKAIRDQDGVYKSIAFDPDPETGDTLDANEKHAGDYLFVRSVEKMAALKLQSDEEAAEAVKAEFDEAVEKAVAARLAEKE